jgi:hypothetical protein
METGLGETLGAALPGGVATVAGLDCTGAAARELGRGVELPGMAFRVSGALLEPEPDLIWKPSFMAFS